MKKQNEAPESRKLKLTRRGTALAIGTSVILGLGGLAEINRNTNDASRNHFNSLEQAAITEANTAENDVIAVRSGATFRSAPVIASNNEEGPVTTAGTVPEGMVLRIDRPIKYLDDQSNTWYGFTIANKGAKPNSAKAADMYWINSTQLASENTAGDPYVTNFSYGKAVTAVSSADISLAVSPDETFLPNSKGNLSVATGQIIDSGIFTQQVAKEGLQLTE